MTKIYLISEHSDVTGDTNIVFSTLDKKKADEMYNPFDPNYEIEVIELDKIQNTIESIDFCKPENKEGFVEEFFNDKITSSALDLLGLSHFKDCVKTGMKFKSYILENWLEIKPFINQNWLEVFKRKSYYKTLAFQTSKGFLDNLLVTLFGDENLLHYLEFTEEDLTNLEILEINHNKS